MAKFTTVEEYLAAQAEPLREVAEKLRPIIEETLPDGSGAIWHGHPVWSLGAAPGRNPVCLLKVYSSYVTFGLWRGQAIDDPSGRLEPGARGMAHVKLRTTADIDPALFATWLQQATALENVS